MKQKSLHFLLTYFNKAYVYTWLSIWPLIQLTRNVLWRIYSVQKLNFETRSRDYATVNEAVFSLCRAELCVPCRAAPRLLLSDNCKHLDRATVRRGHVTSAFHSDVTHPQRVTPATVQNAAFFRVSDREFMGETKFVFIKFSVGNNRGRFVVEDLYV
jgi:hypothetical protein